MIWLVSYLLLLTLTLLLWALLSLARTTDRIEMLRIEVAALRAANRERDALVFCRVEALRLGAAEARVNENAKMPFSEN